MFDTAGLVVGAVEAVELVTIGQRRGVGLPGGGPKRYVVDVDAGPEPHVVVGEERELDDERLEVRQLVWADDPLRGPTPVLVQCSAHGEPRRAVFDGGTTIVWDEPQRRVAPGQSVVLYDTSNTWVHGGGVAARSSTFDSAFNRR